MKKTLHILCGLAVAFSLCGLKVSADEIKNTTNGLLPLIPPATPLIACDPYFSVWSTGKKLTDVDTTHWTGKSHRLVSLVRVDGKTYRLMGGGDRRITFVPASLAGDYTDTVNLSA